MNAAFVWLCARKDLVRQARDPWALLVWLGMPLLIVGLVLLAFGGDDAPPRAKVLVADHDASFLSDALRQALDRVEVIEVEVVDDSTGRVALEKGRATALLAIPEGFGDSVLNERRVTLELVTHPGQSILPGIVEETLEVLADGVFYVQRLFGEDLRAFAAGPPPGASAFPNDMIAGASVRINERIGRLVERSLPPAIALDAKLEATRAGPRLGLGALFFPGVLFMGLLFMSAGVASDVWVEREKGTLRRAVATPQRIADFLAGKVLAGAILMAAVSFVALLVGVASLGIPAAAVLPGTLWSTFSGTAFLLVVILLHLHASTARTAGILTTMALFPLLMVGGSFFPFESMPAPLVRIGQMTPNGWALTHLKGILWGGADPAGVAAAAAGLGAVAVAAFALGARRLRRAFAGGR